MVDQVALPRFRRPPVSEVAVGVQFQIEKLNPTHYGAFYEKLKHLFPKVDTRLPLPPFNVQATAAQNPIFSLMQMDVSSGPPWPRLLFVSADECSLIQIQKDRLYFNWRRQPDGSQYPSYSVVHAEFAKYFRMFQDFVIENQLGIIEVSGCEVFYSNPLDLRDVENRSVRPEEIFRIWNPEVGQEWLVPTDSINFSANYPIFNEDKLCCGHLTTAFLTGQPPFSAPGLRLELSARGASMSPDLSGIQAFHSLGHEAIVRCFTAITTPAMHKAWGRYQ